MLLLWPSPLFSMATWHQPQKDEGRLPLSWIVYDVSTFSCYGWLSVSLMGLFHCHSNDTRDEPPLEQERSERARAAHELAEVIFHCTQPTSDDTPLFLTGLMTVKVFLCSALCTWVVVWSSLTVLRPYLYFQISASFLRFLAYLLSAPGVVERVCWCRTEVSCLCRIIIKAFKDSVCVGQTSSSSSMCLTALAYFC